MEIPDLIAALTRPEAYPAWPGAEVAVVQTHISVLFFVENRVFKVKKPVALEFVDYSTLERRKHFCEEEVRLNRRLARGVYIGTVPIVRAADGRVRVGGPGETIEYAVEMVRLPEERMMSRRLDRGEIDNERLDELVGLLVEFHRAAATGPGVDEHADPAEITRQVEENLAELGASPAPRDVLSSTLREHLRAHARRWLDEHAALLAQRVRDGRAREGHGDLHAGNICLTPDGIVIYDCIEFSPRFRCRDVACEMAFLAMDLDFRCLRGFGGYVLHRYATLTDDPDLPVVAGFYKRHLATVRGKVASLRAADPAVGDDERAAARREAMRYFHLAAAYTLPPALVLMCGLPASGKSHAARALARPFEATVLRSDLVRKELAGAPVGRERDPIDAGLYAPEITDRTYAALLDHAAAAIGRGKTAIVDATFPTAAQREPFFRAAAQLGAPCVLVELTCPEDVVRERLARRAHDPNEVSDADWDVYVHAKTRFEPPEEWPAARRVRLDSRRPPEEITGAVIDRLIAGTGDP